MVGNPVLSLELKGADATALEALGALPGVLSAAAGGGEGCFRLEHEPTADPREAIFDLAVEKGWPLLGLNQEKASLEDVFVRLTTRETTEPAAPAAAEV
jgi:hypothetical protein